MRKKYEVVDIKEDKEETEIVIYLMKSKFRLTLTLTGEAAEYLPFNSETDHLEENK